LRVRGCIEIGVRVRPFTALGHLEDLAPSRPTRELYGHLQGARCLVLPTAKPQRESERYAPQ